MKYSCLIVDDEPIAIRVVKNHLQNFVNIEIAGECANAIEAIEFLGQHQVELIFLDIQMPQLSGIELIRSLQHPPMIIFTTAYRDFAVDAFEFGRGVRKMLSNVAKCKCAKHGITKGVKWRVAVRVGYAAQGMLYFYTANPKRQPGCKRVNIVAVSNSNFANNFRIAHIQNYNFFPLNIVIFATQYLNRVLWR